MPCNNFAGYPGPLTADRAAELLAEDKAIEDALHVLDRALADSRLSIKPYLKVTAAASRPTRMALARGGDGTGPRRGWHWPAAGPGAPTFRISAAAPASRGATFGHGMAGRSGPLINVAGGGFGSALHCRKSGGLRGSSSA